MHERKVDIRIKEQILTAATTSYHSDDTRKIRGQTSCSRDNLTESQFLI